MSIWTPGDVVSYDTLTRPNRWCREGIAIAVERSRGEIVLLDTYWSLGTETHVLTPEEVETAVFRFNRNEYDELKDGAGRPNRIKWERYAPADRERITEQHGCISRFYVRKVAVEDTGTIIENARAAVAERQADVASAQRRLAWAQEDLDRIESEAMS